MLALAARLRALSDEHLVAALAQREFSLQGVRDYFDVAEALLAPESVQAALATLDREKLAVLAVSSELLTEAAQHAAPISPSATHSTAPDAAPSTLEIAERLDALGASIDAAAVTAAAERLNELLLGSLVTDEELGERFAPFSAVAEHIVAWPSHGLPSPAELSAPHPQNSALASSVADTSAVDRLAAERAFGTTAVISEMLTSLVEEPARELARGGLSLPDAKRLAQAAAIEFEEVPKFLALAERAGLVERAATVWQHSDLGEEWLRGGTAARWSALAAAWHSGLASPVRVLLAQHATQPWDETLRSDVLWLFPAAGDALQQRIDDRTAEAELLGITATSIPSAPGSALLAESTAAAEAAMQALLPPEVSQLYLQHDLSAVAPGPLTPLIDARLRTLAEVESREFASSYRITSASINRALAAGETAESLLEFLASISLTGVPQPLNYLITESATRYGRLRIGPAVNEGIMQAAIRSDDAELIHTVSVDHALSALGLQQSGTHRLLSRFSPETLFWALVDARYPVAAEDEHGEVVHLNRRRAPRTEAAPSVDPLEQLVVGLRESDADTEPTGQAWLARQIDVAIRSKHSLIVSVRMPGGELSDYLLEPASVANGRLRARDRRADIERTLPLSSIAAITTA